MLDAMGRRRGFYGAAKEFVRYIDNGELEALRLFWKQVQVDFPVR